MQMSQDTFAPSGEQERSPGDATPKRASIDRLELKHQWEQQEEEQQVEETLNLYVKAAMQRMQGAAPELPPDSPQTEEELETQSQLLRLRQKCQDIAALMLVDELEEEEE